MADWENAWTTKDRTFEMKQLRVFQEMVKRDIIFRRYKPVYWSPSSSTALAEAELEYKDDHESTAAYVKFSMINIPQSLGDQLVDKARLHAVIWTTTPWTLPANRAIAVNPELDYIVINIGKEQLLVAESRLQDLIKALHLDESSTNIVARISKHNWLLPAGESGTKGCKAKTEKKPRSQSGRCKHTSKICV
jgi:isoleucyl-tRNA synthetase